MALAQLLQQHRGVRNVHDLPPLTQETILEWADDHRTRTGAWANENSGPVLAAPGEVWKNIDMALRDGGRSLPGGSTLPRLLAERRGVPNRLDVQRLSVEIIVEWARDHHSKTGRWPQARSGQVLASPQETWMAVEAALSNGCRGLAGGSSVAKLLAEQGVKRNKAVLPRLNRKQIVLWAEAHERRTGRWPNQQDGRIQEAPEETWLAVQMALTQGLRGLKAGSTLARLRPRRRRFGQNFC